jgi:hypothetical protein
MYTVDNGFILSIEGSQSRTLIMVILLLITLDDIGEVLRVNHLQVVLELLPLLETVEDEGELVAIEEVSRHGLALRVLPGRREERIHCNFECILDHIGYDPRQ